MDADRTRSPLVVLLAVIVACAAAHWVGRGFGSRAASEPGEIDLAERSHLSPFEGLPAVPGGEGWGEGDGDPDSSSFVPVPVPVPDSGGRGPGAGEPGPGGLKPGVVPASYPGGGGSGTGTGTGTKSAAATGAETTTATAKTESKAASDVPPEPDGTIAGRVTDPDGAAIARADVKILSGRRTYNQARADDDGRFRVEKVRPGRYKLVARASGFVDGGPPGTFDVAPAQTVTGLDVVLKPSGLVTGRVLDPDGAPVARAYVRAERDGAFGRNDARSGADGRFELRGLPVGKTNLRAEHDAYLPSKKVGINVPKLEDGSPGSVEDVTLALVAGAAIEGTTLAVDGSPLVVDVWLHDSRGRRLERSSSKPGLYRFEGLAAGRYQVVTDRLAGAVARVDDVTIAAGERKRLDLVLEGGGSVAGTCLNELGEPVASVRVTASCPEIAFRPSALSGADGRFQVAGLFDAAYVISALPPELSAVPAPLNVEVTEGAGPQDLLFQIAAGAIVSGRAIRVDGGPAGGALVALHDALTGARHAFADADPGGRFRLVRLPPGDHELYVHAGSELKRLALRLAPAEERTADVQLLPGGKVRGVVRRGGPGGPAAANAVVTATGPNGVVRREARSNGQGAFELRDVYEGRYTVAAKLGSATAAPLEVVVGEGQVVEGLEIVIP